MHVGSIGCRHRAGPGSRRGPGEAGGEAGVFVSYDPNIRPFFFDDREAAWHGVQSLGSGATLVKLSDEDVRFCDRTPTTEDVCRELLAGEQTELVVLTRGPQRGDGVHRGRHRARWPRHPPRSSTRWAPGTRSWPPCSRSLWEWGVVTAGEGTLSALDDSRVELLMRGAVTAAAVTCSRRGANPPTRQELPPTWPAG